MREPIAAGIAPLVTQTPAHVGKFPIIGDDHSAFAGGDLFVGIKAEDAATAKGADFSFFMAAAETFAGILNEGDFMAGGEHRDFVHAAGVAEGFDAEDGLGFRCDGLGGLFDVHVQAGGFDIDEDRRRADHLDDVAGSDKRERGGDDLIPRPDAEGEQTAMQPRRAGAHCDGVFNTQVFFEAGLEFRNLRPKRQVPGPHDLDDRLNFRFADIGTGERDVNIVHETSMLRGERRGITRTMRRPIIRERIGESSGISIEPFRRSGDAEQRRGDGDRFTACFEGVRPGGVEEEVAEGDGAVGGGVLADGADDFGTGGSRGDGEFDGGFGDGVAEGVEGVDGECLGGGGVGGEGG